jgi:hypothetical protein
MVEVSNWIVIETKVFGIILRDTVGDFKFHKIFLVSWNTIIHRGLHILQFRPLVTACAPPVAVAAISEARPIINVPPIFAICRTLISASSVSVAARISRTYSWKDAVTFPDSVAPESSISSVRADDEKRDGEDGGNFHRYLSCIG